MTPETIEKTFRRIAPAADFCSLRFVAVKDELLVVRQDVPEPPRRSLDRGAMLTVIDKGGVGYAATCDLTPAGLESAGRRAKDWAELAAGRSVIDFRKVAMPRPCGEYAGRLKKPWDGLSLEDKFALLADGSRRLKAGPRIVDWHADLWRTRQESLYLTADGGRVHQTFHYLRPGLSASASDGKDTQIRSLGSPSRQGGLEVLDEVGFRAAPERIAAEALELLDAPGCPSGTMDLLIDPDQMVLQIHESIGHPLEMDRVLGDERNYAGTSFVRPEMVGEYRYGSDLLNIVFDPSRPEQLASYAFDDDGLKAEKVHLIEKGILQRLLGGSVSQARAGIAGAACSRACSWNRPPIDRMANLNLEVGSSTLEQMISSVRRGVYVKTNCSWSIDDSRNKFQFGCQWGRLIEDGRLTRVVKKPNYRGISATFWRNLKRVGDESTFEVLGTPNCGKGEPNQIIRVAHASPACLFADVDVFGGA